MKKLARNKKIKIVGREKKLEYFSASIRDGERV
jgi:hypothetical protein